MTCRVVSNVNLRFHTVSRNSGSTASSPSVAPAKHVCSSTYPPFLFAYGSRVFETTGLNLGS
ncbi:hypothetical protein MCOR01_003499 [Pyricularia oryzae]|nr:hypothetical protein MCOR01_003499 [Pyricularia oryzae]